MTDLNDMDLLREFASRNSEQAFAEVVRRHIDLVYSVAWRYTGNFGDAQDVTQAVFIILARKAGSLGAQTVLTGWFYETTRFTAMRLLRDQTRRRVREQEASMQSQFSHEETSDDIWRQLAPHLEAAMSHLGERDRILLALRYYQNKTGAEAASLLGMQEEAARKRTNRALEKLRAFFSRRGISSSTAVIASTLSTYAVQPVPDGLAKGVTAVALAKGTTASVSTLTLIKGGFKLMAWFNAKTAVAVGLGIVLVAGTATVVVQEISKHQEEATWNEVTRLAKLGDGGGILSLPATALLRKTKFFPQADDLFTEGMKGRLLGLAVPTAGIFGHAYDINRIRIVNPELLPGGRYDFLVTERTNQSEALQAAATKYFGIIGKKVTRDTDVLLMQIIQTNAPGLKPATGTGRRRPVMDNGHLQYFNLPLSYLSYRIERMIKIPVILDTNDRVLYDVDITWSDNRREPGLDEIKQALRGQLGIELVPTNMPLEVLELSKAK